MDSAVDDHSWLSLPRVAVEMQAGDGLPLPRVASNDNLGIVGIQGLKVRKPLDVVGVSMVAVEPANIDFASCLSSAFAPDLFPMTELTSRGLYIVQNYGFLSNAGS